MYLKKIALLLLALVGMAATQLYKPPTDFYPLEITNSNFVLTKQDSTQLTKLWKATAHEYFLDTIPPNATNKEIDSMIKNVAEVNFGGITEGHAFIAPDKRFKIYTVEGEGCGAYCSPLWQSVLVLANGTTITNVGFDKVENIYKMANNTYLVIDNRVARPAGYYHTITFAATLFTIKADSLLYKRFNYTYPKYNSYYLNNPSGNLELTQEHYVNAEQYLQYNPKTKTLSYQYGTDFSTCCNIDSAYVYKGKFQYKKEKFYLVKEQKSYFNIDEN